MPNRDDYWPCACVKRDAQGNMSHIRLNHKKIVKCRVCGIKRPPKEWFDRPKNAAVSNA